MALPPTATPIRAQKAESIEHGQTDGSLYRETCWQNGSEYVCLICRWVSRTPAAHEVHTATAHLGCGIPVTWLEERYYDGAALVPDFRSGVNVWRYAT